MSTSAFLQHKKTETIPDFKKQTSVLHGAKNIVIQIYAETLYKKIRLIVNMIIEKNKKWVLICSVIFRFMLLLHFLKNEEKTLTLYC